MIQISKPQNATELIKKSGETQLSEMNVRMQCLHKTMNTFASDNQQEIEGLKSALGNVERQNTELKSGLNNVERQNTQLKSTLNNVERQNTELKSDLNNVERQIEELKSDFKNAPFCIERNKPSVYSIHYSLKNWMDADLACKAEGGHLVSFETVDEQNHVAGLIQWRSPIWGFWTSARDLGDDNWIWRNSGVTVLEALWHRGEPNGDGDCGSTYRGQRNMILNDISCAEQFCYVCETP